MAVSTTITVVTVNGAQYLFKIHYKPYEVIYDLNDLPHTLWLITVSTLITVVMAKHGIYGAQYVFKIHYQPYDVIYDLTYHTHSCWLITVQA